MQLPAPFAPLVGPPLVPVPEPPAPPDDDGEPEAETDPPAVVPNCQLPFTQTKSGLGWSDRHGDAGLAAACDCANATRLPGGGFGEMAGGTGRVTTIGAGGVGLADNRTTQTMITPTSMSVYRVLSFMAARSLRECGNGAMQQCGNAQMSSRTAPPAGFLLAPRFAEAVE
jgi:hypothetical protein